MSGERIKQLASLGRRNALYEAFYNVCGILPPVNNIGHHEKKHSPFPDGWGGMKHAHVIFRGVRRPLTEDGIDKKIYVYAVSPRFVYEYVPDMVCCAKRKPAPKGAVFVAYVVFNTDFSKGEILNWEWVVADQEKPNYPANYKVRYDEEVWSNG